MRAVLSATLAKADFIARLKPILGDGLKVVEGEPAIVDAVPEADALVPYGFSLHRKVAAAVHAAAPRAEMAAAPHRRLRQRQAVRRAGRGVIVTNMGAALAPPVATHAVMLLLALQRQLPVFTDQQSQRVWDRTPGARARIPDQTTVAVIGFGHIGREIARLLRAFGARIIAVSRSGSPHELADEAAPITRLMDVLPRADAVMIAVPLDPKTQGLIGPRELNACKRSALLVNIARGPIVDSLGAHQCAGRRRDRRRRHST